jgi:uncharacterized protein GlcG (DUF336 family)
VAEFATRPGLALKVAGAIGVAGAMTGAQDRHIAEIAVARATT